MKGFTARRVRNLFLVILLAAALIGLDALSQHTLHRAPALSGWALLALVVFLALYNLRKRLPFLPLLSSAGWLQAHIYAGLLSGVIFLLHISWRIPNGVLEIILASLYALVFFSGLFGLGISRAFARRLTTRGEEIIFERIPRARHMMRAHVESLVLDCLKETESTAIPEFYSQRLKDFFNQPNNFFAHLTHSSRARRALLSEISGQQRYLNERERQVMGQIAEAVGTKDDLDYQYAHQATLKYWLFIHVPLTYALLVFAAFHVILVHAFSGGVR